MARIDWSFMLRRHCEERSDEAIQSFDRDGSPLGVTILSSDMGKLYVALAQAIERIRS